MAGGYGGYGNRHQTQNISTMRTVALWAAHLSLLQSLLWIGLTIVGIIAYTCNMPINSLFTYGSLMEYAFYTLYFEGDCIPPNYQQSDFSMMKSVETILSPEDILIWNCVYLGVAVCWFIASLVLLVFLRKNNNNPTNAAIYFWIITILCINAMDLALGIIFGLDYGRFNRAAYNYNLSSLNAGAVLAEPSQLVAGGVAAISLMIIAFKGFILWIVNVGLMCYLLALVGIIANDNDNNDNLFMPRKDSDDVLADRPPIKAYEEEISTNQVYTNNAFVPDNRSVVTVELNQDALSRAARMSTDIALHGSRFRNVDSFQQYPPPSNQNNNNNFANNNNFIKQVSIKEDAIVSASPGILSSFPAPDYTPPMSRVNNGGIHNQRYH